MSTIYNMSCLDLLPYVDKYDLIFADPPDNLGLGYNVYKDHLPDAIYYNWIGQWLAYSLAKADTIILSYYWKHDMEIKCLARNLLKYHFPSFNVKTFIWRYTFGQHNNSDCGSGFRYLLRFNKAWKKINTDDIREMSDRQLMGDVRANPDGRVPDDVWKMNVSTAVTEPDKRKVETNAMLDNPNHPNYKDYRRDKDGNLIDVPYKDLETISKALFQDEKERRKNEVKVVVEEDEIIDVSRVTGNSKERRAWHPTQHPELLIWRLLKLHTKEGDKVLDLFGGTGTVMRVGTKMKRNVDMCEIDSFYCQQIKEEPWCKDIEITYVPPIPELLDNQALNAAKQKEKWREL